MDKENLKFKAEEDKQVIYNSITDEDICMYFGEENKQFLLNLLNKYG